MNLWVFPAVAQVTFVGIEADQSAFPEQSETLRPVVVMFVYFGEAVGKGKRKKEKGKSRGKLGEIEFGENLFHFSSDIGIDSIVIVDMEKSPGDQVVSQVLGFGIGEHDITMAGHVDEREGEDIPATGFHGSGIFPDVSLQVFITEADQVGQGGGIGVPVAAAAVLEKADP